MKIKNDRRGKMMNTIKINGFKVTKDQIKDLNLTTADKVRAKQLISNTTDKYVCFTLGLDSLTKLTFTDNRLKSYIAKFLYRNSYFYGKLAEIILYRFGHVDALAKSNMFLGKGIEDTSIELNEGPEFSIPDTLYIFIDINSSFWEKTYTAMLNNFVAYCCSSEVDLDLPNFPEVTTGDPNPFSETPFTDECFTVISKSYRYYSTQRPIGPGTYPTDHKILNVENFGKIAETKGIKAWGYIEFDSPLTDEDQFIYDLVPAKQF